MKVRELRIGNQILINSKITIINATDIEYIFNREKFGCEIENCNPIKLSEDILKRLNFKYEYEKMSDKIYSLENFKICINKTEGCHFYHVDTKIGQSFHYLHQLQNLYFDLIGECLTL